MEIEQLFQTLKDEGYSEVRLIEGRGLVGLSKLLYTTGIVYGLDESGYKGRFCYHTREEALSALNEWDGIGDPPGNWIVNKGEKGGDRYNPRTQKPPMMGMSY